MDQDARRFIQEIESERKLAHETMARVEAQRADEEQAAYEKRSAYIARHGKEGAAQLTMQKWGLAGLVFGVIVLFMKWSEEGFLEGVKMMFGQFILFGIIGYYRAQSIRRH